MPISTIFAGQTHRTVGWLLGGTAYVKCVCGVEDERQVHVLLTYAGRELRKAAPVLSARSYAQPGRTQTARQLPDDLAHLRASLLEHNKT